MQAHQKRKIVKFQKFNPYFLIKIEEKKGGWGYPMLIHKTIDVIYFLLFVKQFHNLFNFKQNNLVLIVFTQAHKLFLIEKLKEVKNK